VHNAVVEPMEQVLAVGLRTIQDPSVDAFGARREPPLRRGRRHRSTNQNLAMQARVAMEQMSLGHVPPGGLRGKAIGVQTFLPYPDFARSARALDPRRLGKQRVEVLQICNALHRETGGWINHPVTRMWRGYEPALVAYGLAVTRRWVRLGHVDTVHDKLVPHLHGEPERTQRELRALGMLPPWLGRRDLHRAYRSALVRKDPELYRPLFPDVASDLEYVWPA
jgi:Pyrimidine dimer DNA glycosylase